MGSNPALVLMHNNLSLTKLCVESLRKQDIQTSIFCVDNGSSDNSVSWTQEERLPCLTLLTNTGFSYGINIGLRWIFELTGAGYCLPSYAYRELLSYDLPWVSGRETNTLSDLDLPFEQGELGGGPQFSMFLIRKAMMDKMGGFDESMVSWASDCDFHIRAHRLGIKIESAPVRYYHERSSTINNAAPKEKRGMEMQADVDRMAFVEKWKIPVWSPEYASMFSPDTFGIDAK